MDEQQGQATEPVEAQEQVNDGVGGGNNGGPESGDVAQAAKEAARRLKYKTKDGQELEVDEDEALRTWAERKAHQAAASKELNEGKALRKQAEQLVEMLKDKGKLRDVMKKLGHDPRKLSEEILAEHLEDELMDPRDRELRDAKRRLEQIDAMERQQKEALEAKRLQEVKSRYMAEYEKEFITALDTVEVPKSKETISEMAKYIYRAGQIGFKMTANEAAKLVKEDILERQRRIFSNADGETLLKLFGEDVANKIRKADLAKLKNPNANLSNNIQQAETHRDRTPKKRLSSREWQLHKRGLK
jgi:hypothetical protein